MEGGRCFCQIECIEKFISFSDGWSKITDRELKPTFACRFDEEGCFGSSSKD